MVIAAFPWQYLRTAGGFFTRGFMSKKKNKPRKVFCLRKDNQYIAWDGKTLTDKPSNALRTSKTMAERKYPGFEMITYPEAYKQWYEAITKPIHEKAIEEIKASGLT